MRGGWGGRCLGLDEAPQLLPVALLLTPSPPPTPPPHPGVDRELYMFDEMATTPFVPGQPSAFNALALSRGLPDPRGGLRGAGADEALVAATKAVTLSTRRAETFEQW